MNIFEMLRNDGSISINKKLLRKIGVHTAIIYSELLSKYFWYKDKEMLDINDMFFCTIEDLEYSTGLTHYQQSKAIQKLIDFK